MNIRVHIYGGILYLCPVSPSPPLQTLCPQCQVPSKSTSFIPCPIPGMDSLPHSQPPACLSGTLASSRSRLRDKGG